MSRRRSRAGSGAASRGGGKAVPRYLEIADEIVQQIRAGVLKPGDMVPNESVVGGRYSASAGTIRKAMVEARASGLVVTSMARVRS